MKIGITERGDPSIDFSWVEKSLLMDGTILITKGVAKKEFVSTLMSCKNRDKIILHATITGLGGTCIESGVPSMGSSINSLDNLIEMGFDPRKIVVRVDPLIYSHQIIAMRILSEACSELGIDRIRFSIVTPYEHVKRRFENLGVEFSPDIISDKSLSNYLRSLAEEFPNISYEECNANFIRPKMKNSPCVSEEDVIRLGLENDTYRKTLKMQRPNCKCLGIKTELLENKYRCEHKCLYCYWKDKNTERYNFV